MLRNLKLWILKSSESKHFTELILNQPKLTIWDKLFDYYSFSF